MDILYLCFHKIRSCFTARAAALSNEQKQKIENNNMKQLVAPKPPNKEYKLSKTKYINRNLCDNYTERFKYYRKSILNENWVYMLPDADLERDDGRADEVRVLWKSSSTARRTRGKTFFICAFWYLGMDQG